LGIARSNLSLPEFEGIDPKHSRIVASDDVEVRRWMFVKVHLYPASVESPYRRHETF